MKIEDKIGWMRDWANRNGAVLELQGTCGFGRDCVGIIANTVYPDYIWYDEKYKRIDLNGVVWSPKDAYHKHPCVAVLGHSVKSIEQLYKWICWFNDNGFILEQRNLPSHKFTAIELFLDKHRIARMVKSKRGVI